MDWIFAVLDPVYHLFSLCSLCAFMQTVWENVGVTGDGQQCPQWPAGAVYFPCNLCTFMQFMQFMQFMRGFGRPAPLPAVDLAAAGPQPTCSSLILKQIPLGTRRLTWFGPTDPVYFVNNLCSLCSLCTVLRGRPERAPSQPRQGPAGGRLFPIHFMQFMHVYAVYAEKLGNLRLCSIKTFST